MQRPYRDSPFLPPPTDKEIKVFAKYKRDGPTKENFRVDVRGKNQKSAWNRRCAELFASEFVLVSGASTRDVSVVSKAFLSHVQTLCLQYKKQPQGESDGEDDAEEANNESKIQNVRRARKAKVSHHLVSTHIDVDIL